ncbi:hypothetical protein FQA39_LY05498 [Lamprigera yunnana]|nr:hypothetical protein FQA39_LY05498 [Lamprigera yunnana]
MKMASKYKLTYFPTTGVAEPIRFLFSYGKLEFEDIRFEIDDWPKIKPTMPFGQVPVLEVDGKLANQSVAICRYVGELIKLDGVDTWENLEINGIADTVNDLRASKYTTCVCTSYYNIYSIEIAAYHYEKDPDVKENLKGPLFNETLPYYLERLDAIVKANDSHLAVGKLTWADFFFVGLLDYLDMMLKKKMIEGYPNLLKLESIIVNLPAIKDWIENRPESQGLF